MIDCPFKLGQAVRIVVPESGDTWQSDWRGTWIVVGMTLEYQKGDGINFSLASQDEIEHGLGSTDGFYVNDLQAA